MSIDPKSEFKGIEEIEKLMAETEFAEASLLKALDKEQNTEIFKKVICIAQEELTKRMVSFGHTDQTLASFHMTLKYFSSLLSETPQSGKIKISTLHHLFNRVSEASAKFLEELKEPEVKNVKHSILLMMYQYEINCRETDQLEEDSEQTNEEAELALDNLEIDILE